MGDGHRRASVARLRGAGLIRPSPLERIYRDLSFYVLHDNADQVLATIGREILGQPHDASFFNPPPDPAAQRHDNHRSGAVR